MLEDKDIQKLIDVFATKEDLQEAVKNLSTKEDFNKLLTAVDSYARKPMHIFKKWLCYRIKLTGMKSGFNSWLKN